MTICGVIRHGDDGGVIRDVERQRRAHIPTAGRTGKDQIVVGDAVQGHHHIALGNGMAGTAHGEGQLVGALNQGAAIRIYARDGWRICISRQDHEEIHVGSRTGRDSQGVRSRKVNRNLVAERVCHRDVTVRTPVVGREVKDRPSW